MKREWGFLGFPRDSWGFQRIPEDSRGFQGTLGCFREFWGIPGVSGDSWGFCQDSRGFSRFLQKVSEVSEPLGSCLIFRDWTTMGNVQKHYSLPFCNVFELQPNKGTKMEECAKHARFEKTIKICLNFMKFSSSWNIYCCKPLKLRAMRGWCRSRGANNCFLRQKSKNSKDSDKISYQRKDSKESIKTISEIL